MVCEEGTLYLCSQMETNPVLKNITDYLIEEVSAEEEELTGAAGGGDEAGDGRDPTTADVTVETDEKLLKVGGAMLRPVTCQLSRCV